ncbi:hypothetical protein ASG54_22490 [Aureimonas sp. Leaf460]|nr:hypothetical protein ASG62_24925 [Aureimonas sp. Leaf427]KQT65892.1 hypothetical protein ASG54_22490 [Aureimonas sp. Leaf460]
MRFDACKRLNQGIVVVFETLDDDGNETDARFILARRYEAFGAAGRYSLSKRKEVTNGAEDDVEVSSTKCRQSLGNVVSAHEACQMTNAFEHNRADASVLVAKTA